MKTTKTDNNIISLIEDTKTTNSSEVFHQNRAQTLTMSIIERVRASGGCPPSLIGVDSDTGFETAALKVVDANGMSVVRFV